MGKAAVKKSAAKEALRVAAIDRMMERFLARFARLADASRAEDPALHAQQIEALGPEFPKNACGVLSRLVVATVEALIDRPEIRIAVLERAELLCDGWALHDLGGEPLPPPVVAALARLAHVERQQGIRPAALRWPPDVAPVAVSAALRNAKDPDADRVAAAIGSGLLGVREQAPPPPAPEPAARRRGPRPSRQPQQVLAEIADGHEVAPELALALTRWPVLRCAHVVAVTQRVERDRMKAMLAVDGSREHDALLGGMRDLPKNERSREKHRVRRIKAPDQPDRFEIIPPKGAAVQLTLPIDGVGGSLSEALALAIQQWRSWEGLRHYSAMLRIFSIEGAREGRARWTMSRHLDAIGASTDNRQDPEYLARVGREVELMTLLELAVYAPDGSLRVRQPLFRPGTKYDRLHGSTWALDGLELEIHPFLYRGVRDLETGKLGTNWYPQSAALPTIDHVRFPYAYPLGLILPIRWLWDWKDGRDHLRISGSKLLQVAGIPFDVRRPAEAWSKLRRNLEKLADLDPPAVGRIAWEGEPWSLGGIALLYAPQWARDRTIHQITPVEPPKALATPPVTGADVAAWRKRENLTQAAAAKRLGVSERTIRSTEKAPGAAVGPALARAFPKLATKTDRADDRQPSNTTGKKPGDPLP